MSFFTIGHCTAINTALVGLAKICSSREKSYSFTFYYTFLVGRYRKIGREKAYTEKLKKLLKSGANFFSSSFKHTLFKHHIFREENMYI